MKNENFDLKQGDLPQEFVLINSKELYTIEGGSRQDPKQKEWFGRLVDFVVGSLFGGPATGAATATT